MTEFHTNHLAMVMRKLILFRYETNVTLKWHCTEHADNEVTNLMFLIAFEEPLEEFIDAMWSEKMGDIGEDPAKDSERLKMLIEWVLMEGKRADIDPYGHCKQTMPKDILTYCDNKVPKKGE
jgi:hypothetical protein